MASSFSTNLRLELMATGEKDGTWGTTANDGVFQLLEDAMTAEHSISTTGGTTTLSTANGATDEARDLFLDISGTLTSNSTIAIPDVNKFYFVRNGTSGAFTVTIKPSGTGYVVVQGEEAIVYCDGTNAFPVSMPFFTVDAFAKTFLDDTSASAVRTTLSAQEDVITTRGDIVRGSASAVAERLAVGSRGDSLVSDGTDTVWASGYYAKNVIINGNFDIWQRGTSWSPISDDQYSADRWEWEQTGPGVANIIKSTVVPNNTSQNSFRVDVSTAATSLAAGDVYSFEYKVEGYDAMRFAFGTSDAQQFTLSFWVRSPKTGSHYVALRNRDEDRSYPAKYTVSAADTWEFKTITLTADTTGTWRVDNLVGINISWILAAGSAWHGTADTWQAGLEFAASDQVNVMDNAANNFYVSQVQLELGSVATAFERRPFPQELALCQRYFAKTYNLGDAPGAITTAGSLVGYSHGTGAGSTLIMWDFPVSMRATPTPTVYNPNTGAIGSMDRSGTAITSSAQATGEGRLRVRNDVTTTDGTAHSAHCIVNAEL